MSFQLLSKMLAGDAKIYMLGNRNYTIDVILIFISATKHRQFKAEIMNYLSVEMHRLN